MIQFLTVCLNPTLQVTVRLPGLTPGQVNRAVDSRLDASGKGVNVTRILSQLGEDVVHLTHTGGRYQEEFARLASDDDLTIDAVRGSIEIRHCYTLLTKDSNQTTEIVEPGGHATPELERSVLEAFERILPSSHTVIISGSKAPGYSQTLYPEMVRLAREARTRVILDYRGDDLAASLPEHPDLIKINVSEFAQTFLDMSIPEDLPPADLPKGIATRMITLDEDGISVVLTNGRQPVMFVEDGAIREITPVQVVPVNTIGAGDSMTAGIAAGLHRGQSLRASIELGLDCARRNVELLRPGVIR